ncbi:unnamed protein product, partial [Meganyctiphanes norvegica]
MSLFVPVESSQSISVADDGDHTSATSLISMLNIPKYMKDKWAETSTAGSEVGRLKIMKVPGKLPAVTFSLAEVCLKDAKLPREHKFILHSVKEQTLGVFSHSGPVANSDAVVPPDTEKLYMEGQVIQKFECQPVVDRAYLSLKREAAKKAEEPQRKASFIERPVHVYKPIAKHKHNIEFEERKKTEGKKARDDKDKVMEMLYSAFEKHQYYNIKDLQKITKQPITYLKEILKEMCDYNMKNPHKNMWELKPEYRHYKSDNPQAEDKNSSDSD